MVTLKIEGQEYPLEDDVANHGATVEERDRFLREALLQFPVAAGATFLREERNGALYITLVKHPASKGGSPLQQLLEAAPSINPVTEVACKVHRLEMQGRLTWTKMLALEDEINAAIKYGNTEEQHIRKALHVLRVAPAVRKVSVEGE